ncbi:Uncharacterised protein [Klebsiella pneumoniae]|uniref:hypothetical protein n=1 Tax=Klebsiella pneumoniae complex TaxID=3390273 RepID=UPI000E2C1DAD|nr:MULTISPECIES: hypothetical protein [Klebsiella]MCP6674486.1 hypothetical protein [Klebsiella pneumoniae]THG63269.1 hypothetical protein E5980_14625 [Klebsiella variicola]SVO06557.1 Uncharacterised protein [Klebsiella pneumoniae]VVL20382.1 Uncharacterised protein [Klebsiella pneumoniae]HBV5383273.1 hypothetical protein [Klebsiella pneumoniae]
MNVLKRLTSKIYRFLLFPLFILLLVIIGIFSVGILYNTLALKADAGSLPDWIAAASSLATTVIAWLAFRSAPLWLQQKVDEKALNDAESLIEKYVDLRLILGRMKLAKENLISVFRNTDEKETLYGRVIHAVAELQDKTSALHPTLKEIENLQSKLSRKGWKIKKEYVFLDEIGLNRILLLNEFDDLISTTLLTNISLLEYSANSNNENSLREIIIELNNNSKRFDNAYIKSATITNKILSLACPVVDIFHK